MKITTQNKKNLQGKIIEKGIKFYEDFASTLKLKWAFQQHRCSSCPFCKSNTDDCFHVQRHLYYCYECKINGDPISYLLNTRKCSFESAFESLAIWCGLDLDEEKESNSNDLIVIK